MDMEKLIEEYHSGNISDENMAHLQNLLAESKEALEEFVQDSKLRQAAADTSGEKKDFLAKIREQENQSGAPKTKNIVAFPQLNYVVSIAAAVIIVLGIGFLLKIDNESGNGSVTGTAANAPETVVFWYTFDRSADGNILTVKVKDRLQGKVKIESAIVDKSGSAIIKLTDSSMSHIKPESKPIQNKNGISATTTDKTFTFIAEKGKIKNVKLKSDTEVIISY
jgi:hypothetical protein